MKKLVIDVMCGLTLAVCFLLVLGFTGKYEIGETTTVQYLTRTVPVVLVALFASRRFFS